MKSQHRESYSLPMLYANVHNFSFAPIILPLCISAYILDIQGPIPNQNLMVQQKKSFKIPCLVRKPS